jgi:hypothetical protein
MTALYEQLLESSIQAAISSIEIYNKPDFKYREQSFTILNVNAWELLLKAKLLKDNADDVRSLYVRRNDGTLKTNRSGNPLTIEIAGAMRQCSLDENVIKNLEHLIEIRDTAVHFYHDVALAYIVYILGVASLKNFQRLIKDWFDRSLLEYNFYILPLGFAYGFQTLSLLEVEHKPEALANLIKSVSSSQESVSETSSFHFVCEVSTQLVSAKKITGEPDVVAQVDKNAPPGSIIVERFQRLTDKYPLSYKQVWQRVKDAKPEVKQGEFNQIMKKLRIKGDLRYSSYNFWSKEHQDRYEKDGVLAKATACIYNEDAVRLIIENL